MKLSKADKEIFTEVLEACMKYRKMNRKEAYVFLCNLWESDVNKKKLKIVFDEQERKNKNSND